jgi:hypothetical protein
VRAPEVTPAEQSPDSPALVANRALLTAVLIAPTPDRVVGPTAGPGPLLPLVTAIRADTLVVPVPQSPRRVITGAGEGAQGDGEHASRAPPSDPPTRLGNWFSGWLVVTLEQLLRDGAGEQPRPIVPAVVVNQPGVAVAIPLPVTPAAAPEPQPAARSGAAVRVVVLVIAAVWLSGRWSAGPSPRADALRHRLSRKMAAFHRGQGG